MIGHPRILGHRGASAIARENTISAFDLAREQGADGVELDVRRSADGALVLLHDAQLEDGRAVIETETADLPDWMPTLDAALDACSGLFVNVETKCLPGEPDFDRWPEVVEAVLERLRGRTVVDLLLSSFHWPAMDHARSLGTEVPTALLSMTPDAAPASLGAAVAGGHVAVHPYHLWVDGDFVTRAHDVGLEVTVWTVDDPDRIRALAEIGIDGIVTNVPDVALAALSRG